MHKIQVEYLGQFAKIELFENEVEIKKRVEKRDAMIDIIPENGKYYIMTHRGILVMILNFHFG